MTALVCTGALLAACGGGGDESGTAAGQEQGTAQESATPEVDPAALDTGDYLTTPQEPFGTASGEQADEVEAQRLAEYVVAPFEIDPTLTTVSTTPSVAAHSGQLSFTFSGPVLEAIKTNTMIVGFVTGARTPTADYSEVPRSMVHGVLRAPDPESARQMAADMNAASLAGGDEFTTPDSPWTPRDARLAGALTTQKSREDRGQQMVTRQTYTAHGDYVLYGYASAPESEADWTERVLADTLEKQKPLTDAFPATPTWKQLGGDDPEPTQVDQDKILIYTLPSGEDEEVLSDYMAVYGPRGFAHFSSNPPLAYQVLTEVGAEHTALGGESTVYRAKDDEGARRIVEQFGAEMVNRGAAEAPAPAGLPTAECYARTTQNGEVFSCYVVNGRYVGFVSASERKDMEQKASAQYLILTHADQDA